MNRTGLSRLAIVITVTTLVLSGCSKREQPGSPEPGGRPGAVGSGGAGANVRSDDDFLRDVAAKHSAEMELSRRALDKASNPSVKAFAQRMVDEHAAAGKALESIASEQGIGWPVQLDEKQKKVADELAGRQGADFDREYVKAMVEAHQDLAAKLESRLDVQSVADWKTAAAARTHTSSLPDPQSTMRDVQVRPDKSDRASTTKINQWAAEVYPVAQQHLDAARTLENMTKEGSKE